jgi:hypothetical protein
MWLLGRASWLVASLAFSFQLSTSYGCFMALQRAASYGFWLASGLVVSLALDGFCGCCAFSLSLFGCSMVSSGASGSRAGECAPDEVFGAAQVGPLPGRERQWA